MALSQIGWMVSTDFGGLMSHEVEFNLQRSALSIQPWISGLTDLRRNLAPRFSDLDSAEIEVSFACIKGLLSTDSAKLTAFKDRRFT